MPENPPLTPAKMRSLLAEYERDAENLAIRRQMLSENIGRSIQRMRKELHLKQKTMAKAMGLKSPHLSMLECPGTVGRWNSEHLEKALAFLSAHESLRR